MLNLLVDDDVIEVRMHDGLECSEYAYEIAHKPKAKKSAIQSFSRLAYRAEALELDDEPQIDWATQAFSQKLYITIERQKTLHNYDKLFELGRYKPLFLETLK